MPTESKTTDASSTPWYDLAIALAGAVLMWASLPPCDWGFLGWIAPIPWLVLVRQPKFRMRRPYRMVYLVGLLYVGGTFYWLTLPHWTAIFGWIALTVYLACYFVLFVSLSRVAVHTARVPLIVAAPVVWTGLEIIRAHVASGILLTPLGATQYRWIDLIQVSDLVGIYGVSFLVLFVASCLARMLPLAGKPFALWPLAPLAVGMGLVLTYGHVRLRDTPMRAGPKVAIIQGSIDTVFGGDPKAQVERIYTTYMDETMRALHSDPDVDVIVWPESMYIFPLIAIDEGAYLPPEELARWPQYDLEQAKAFAAEKKLPETFYEAAQMSRRVFWRTTKELRSARAELTGQSAIAAETTPGPSILLGVNTEHYAPGKLDRYNSSVHIGGHGEVLGVYHKMHPVMFGEYIPLGDMFPWLYNLSPLGGGLTAGEAPKAYSIGGAMFAPNICYETILPHVIRQQMTMLNEAGTPPDVLVTQTNDGWFWGSAALDLHLICGVFRAVESRTPLLIAANTGISASIDSEGRIVARTEKQKDQHLVVRPALDARDSFYVRWGDWFAWLCAGACGLLTILGIRNRYQLAT